MGFLMPPAIYDHPYDGTVVAEYLSYQQLQRDCEADAIGCAAVVDGVCAIILPNWLSPVILDRVRRHEVAHCNGWPADHEGGQ